MPIRKISEDLMYYLIAFDKDGNEREESGSKLSQQILQVLSSEPITDVFLMSHGWLGDVPAAINQYNAWIKAMAANVADIEKIQQIRPGFRPLLIGLHWPSKPWGDEDLGGGEQVSFAVSDSELTIDQPTTQIEQLVNQYAERIADTDAARQALRTIFSSAQETTVADTLPVDVQQAYKVLDQEAALGSDGVEAAPGADREIFDPDGIFQAAVQEEPVSFGIDAGNGLREAFLQPLRMLSFWKMKDRARQFGERGAHQLLKELQQATPDTVRFHLMGHSFGCIVISAMLAGLKGRGLLVRPVHSVALLQGALSLWSYCSDIDVAPGRPGYFHGLVADRKVAGPIITTQSVYDTAVGKMYPLGAGIVRSDINFDPNKLPEYGGLGTWGAQGGGLDVVNMKMLPCDLPYQLESGKIYNLRGDQYICVSPPGAGLGGAHSDIAKPEVAHAVWSAAYTA